MPLARLNQGENHLEYELEAEELGVTEHEVAENPTFEALLGPVRVRLDISRTGRRILIRGRVAFRARLQCSTCGREFERDFDEEMVGEYASWEDDSDVADRELDKEDLSRARLEGDMLDLRESVRDAIHLAIPMAPRCRPDCKGVCPECGTDLNEGTCDCAAKARVRTSPFAGLNEPDKPAD